jgi:excisionase family DNA binding protein
MEYLTVTQAAAEFGMSPRGVRFRIERGEMAAERINPRLMLIPRAEVERWKELGRQKPGPKREARPNASQSSELEHPCSGVAC